MIVDLDYNAITALSGLVAAIIAAAALLAEGKRSRFSIGVDIILKLDERFNTEELRKIRRVAAKSILDKTYRDAEEVLDFFEMMGLMVRKGALNEEMVWNLFFYWIHRYRLSANEYIEKERQKDSMVWANLIYLHDRVVAIEKRISRCSDSDLLLSEQSLKEFLEEESNL